ncbi:transposase [Micromonospora sp. WMMD1082]|nr:transposase [Micromonospora sp. WMMD1082]MDG4795526.1 transposase [Micromonospora sp. WMMD1082]
MPRRYPPEFRRKVLELLKAGRSVAELVRDLEISDQTIYNWRRQELIDTGRMPGVASSDQAELVAARRRIPELETELAVHRRAAELLKEVVPPGTGPSRPATAAQPVRGRRRGVRPVGLDRRPDCAGRAVVRRHGGLERRGRQRQREGPRLRGCPGTGEGREHARPARQPPWRHAGRAPVQGAFHRDGAGHGGSGRV